MAISTDLLSMIKNTTNEVKLSSTPVADREFIAADDAIGTVCPLAPATVRLISKVITNAFQSATSEEAPLSPFRFTPYGTITTPASVLKYCKEEQLFLPVGGKEANPSYRNLAVLSGITTGTLTSVNAGRQKWNVEQLELWRVMLASIGLANGHDALTKYEDPEDYFEELLDDHQQLTSLLPLHTIKEWASTYAEMGNETMASMLASKEPTYSGFYNSVVQVWRDEVVTRKVESYTAKVNFDQVIKDHTGRRSMKRGFHKLAKVIHSNMPRFNDKVTYPVTNLVEYTRRYSDPRAETGMTADIAMAYCFFLGINPLGMLHWFAYNETVCRGQYSVNNLALVRSDLLKWQGAISPYEYGRFLNMILKMSLVSDQDRWTLLCLKPEYVFRGIPTLDGMMKTVGDRAIELRVLIEDEAMLYPKVPFSLPDIGYFELTMRNLKPFNMDEVTREAMMLYISGGMIEPASGVPAGIYDADKVKSTDKEVKLEAVTTAFKRAHLNVARKVEGEQTYLNGNSFNMQHSTLANAYYYGLAYYNNVEIVSSYSDI